MRHVLTLEMLDSSGATFRGFHQLTPFPPSGHSQGTEPYGPFRCRLEASMSRLDWDAADRPLDLEVDL
jgi:hypothetical protein